jgi:signal transduction histidine kinase
MPPLLNFWQNLKKLLTSLRRRLWWFDVIYPLALGLLLFSALSFVVYAGQRQWRLSLQGEKKLLEFSLLQASRGSAPRQHQILVVSADPAQLAANRLIVPNAAPDAPVAVYAAVIERLAAAGVPLLFVRWDLHNHQGDEAGYEVLGRVLAAYRAVTQVYFVLPSEQGERLPVGLLQNAAWLDSAACGEASEVQSLCSYLPEYRQWAVQRVAEVFARTAVAPATPGWVSDQLPNAFPSYILQLRPMHKTAQQSFSSVLRATAVELAGWRSAFIGVGQAPVAVTSSGAGDLVATLYDRFTGAVATTGTPLHEFLAMVAQMFSLSGEVRVPPAAFSMVMTVLVCLALVAVTVLYDVFVGLAVLLGFGLCAPLANAALLRYAKVYIPLFDSYYFGLSALIVAGLVQLSLLSLQRWRLEALRRIHTRRADLKGNFISLLTHNLNTPVAKMQGMLTLLTKQAASDNWLPAAVQAEALVTQLEFAIRSVLIAAALEEGAVHLTARHARALMDELMVSSLASLRRLGVRLTQQKITSEGDGQEFLPLLLDARAVNAAISGVAALFHAPGALVQLSVGMDVGLAVDADNEAPQLQVVLTSTSHWISPEAAAILTATAPLQLRSLSDGLFFPAVLAGLAQLTAATFRGRIELRPMAAGGVIILTFKALSQGALAVTGTELA